MEKLPMCRICLVENVRMYLVVNKDLHELYERLTDIPFVTEDSRPMLTCFFCCTKLKQCCRFLRKCLQAEEFFAEMMKDDYEPEPFINPENFKFFNGFINSPIEHINIFDDSLTESHVIKEELPADGERQDDINPEEEYQTYKTELESLDNTYPDVEDSTAHHAESNLEDEVSLMEIKIEVEEQISIGAPDAGIPKLNSRSKIPEDAFSTEQKKNENSRIFSSTIIKKTQTRTSKRMSFKEPLTKTKHGIESKHNNTALSCSNTNRVDIKCKISNKDTGYRDDIKRCRCLCVKEKRFECDVCQRSFNRKNTLTRHIRTHTGERPFKCDICLRTFAEKFNLTQHIRTHTGEKPFKCDICQRTFRSTSDLTVHIRVHTGEKPYKCDICQRSFSQRTTLAVHSRTHTGEKLFKCGICQRSFSRNSRLTSHIFTHTGEKPFKCDICQRSFSHRGTLTSHTRTHTAR